MIKRPFQQKQMLDIQSDQISRVKLNEMLSSLLNACKMHACHTLSTAGSQRQSGPQGQGP